MPALDVSLPLDPLLSTSHWAWLLALCVATIATFSRLSVLSFIMDSKPINIIISSRHAKLHHQFALEEQPPPSEAEHTTTEQYEVPCMKQEGAEKGYPWSFLHQRWEVCAGGRNEEEEERDVPPRWVYPLLEASRTPLEACRACTSSPSRLVQATNFRSWSQDLHRHIFARVGMPWHITETRVGMGCIYQENGPSLVDYFPSLCTHEVSKVWSAPTISTIHADTRRGFAHVGCRGGDIALWDVEKRLCLNRVRCMNSPISALVVLPSHLSVDVAAGPQHLKRTSTVVSVWDDRCAQRSVSFTLTIPATSPTTAFECGADEFCVAGGGYLSMHDLRMLKEKPISLYSPGQVGGGGRGNRKEERRPYMREYDFNSPSDVVEEAEDSTAMDNIYFPSTNHLDDNLDGSQYRRKRRCSFLTNCLSFMCCLIQYPPLL